MAPTPSSLDPQADLLRALGGVVRGLSVLFWVLPIGILLGARSVMSDLVRPMGVVPPMLAAAGLVYGLTQLARFQRQERVWISALDRTRLLAVVLLGLSPFIYWYNRVPSLAFFAQMVDLLVLTALGFLFALNHVLYRLACMLPDETLRQETTFFTRLDRGVLAGLAVVWIGHSLWTHWAKALASLAPLTLAWALSQSWMLLLAALLPLAITMTLIWKTKEVILASVFAAR